MLGAVLLVSLLGQAGEAKPPETAPPNAQADEKPPAERIAKEKRFARVAEPRAPLGKDAAAYLAMLECLAARDSKGLAKLLATGRGGLVERSTRMEILGETEEVLHVRLLKPREGALGEGYLGRRWLELLDAEVGKGRVEPRIQALTEFKEKQSRRSNAEQEILERAFQAQQQRHEVLKPVPPPTTGEPVAPPAPPAPATATPVTAAAGGVPAFVPVSPTTPATAPASPPPIAAVPPQPVVKKAHMCGAITKAGTPCRRLVSNGVHCYQHGG